MDLNNYLGFVYLWENKITGKRYIGAHAGKIDDGYIGSGRYFKKSIEKYGLNNFERKILHFEYENIKNLWQKEFDIINEHNAVKSKQYYNLCNVPPKLIKFINGKIEKNVTEETKLKLSKIAKNRKMSDKTKEKMSKSSFIKNKKWYNNGKQNKVFTPNNEPDGWVLGRIKTSSGNLGYKTYNNGTIERQFKQNEIPDGWSKGRLKKNILFGKNNKFYGRKHSQKSIEKIIETKKNNGKIFYGKSNPAAVSIKVNDKIYETIKSAMEDTGLSYTNIKKIGEYINENNKKENN